MDVTLPDGTVVKGVPDGTTKAQLAEKLKANGRDVPREWLGKRSPKEMIGRQVGLAARYGIEGLAALPLMIADAPTSIRRTFGQKTPPKFSEGLHDVLTEAGLPEPETGVERVIGAASEGMAGAGGTVKLSELGAKAATSPAMKSALGKMASGPGAQVGGGAGASAAAQTTAEAGGGPALQTLAGLATLARPGSKAPGAESIRNPANSVKLRTFQEANAAGYKFPPSVIERGMGREELESIGGKAATKQQAALHNQQTTNNLAKQGASLNPNQELTEENLAQARSELAQPYREVAAVSPEAKHALDTWKDANARAKLHWNDYQRNQTATAKEKYDYFNELQEVSQSVMEDEAIRTGNQQLVARLRDARVKIAQNWDVDRALNIGSGDVRANELGKMLNKRGEKGMSGPLGVIAKTQQAFPEYMTESARTSTPGVNKLSFIASGALGLEGYHSLGLKGAAVGAAIPQISRGARALSLSNMMQKPRSQGQGIPLSALTEFLAKEQGQ